MGYSCRECKNENTTVCACCSNYMGVPDRFESKPQTKGDLIRSMDDERLAEFLYVKTCLDGFPQFSSKEEWLEWLKKEA